MSGEIKINLCNWIHQVTGGVSRSYSRSRHDGALEERDVHVRSWRVCENRALIPPSADVIPTAQATDAALLAVRHQGKRPHAISDNYKMPNIIAAQRYLMLTITIIAIIMNY